MRRWLPLMFWGMMMSIPAFAVQHYHELAFDYPIDSGGMVMYSHRWILKPTLDLGFVTGGGVINRDFDIKQANGLPELKAHTEATVLPYFGPTISLHGTYFGVSLAYGFYYARSKFEVDGFSPGLSSKKNAWGHGFYSPLLTLDFYSSKYDMIFGFGLGGFFGSGYPTMVADNGAVRVESKGDPIDTLTIHVRTRWFTSKSKREQKEKDELE